MSGINIAIAIIQAARCAAAALVAVRIIGFVTGIWQPNNLPLVAADTICAVCAFVIATKYLSWRGKA